MDHRTGRESSIRELVPISDQPTSINERAYAIALLIPYPRSLRPGPSDQSTRPDHSPVHSAFTICSGAICPVPFNSQSYRISSIESQNRVKQSAVLASMQAWVALGACKSAANSGLTVLLLSRLSAAKIVSAAEGSLAADAADLAPQSNRKVFCTSALPSLSCSTASWLCGQSDSVPRGTDGCLRHMGPSCLRSWSSAAVMST